MPATRRTEGDSIEADGATLSARRISPTPPSHDSQLGKQVYGFEIKDTAKATVRVELSPKSPIKNPKSLVDQGDSIVGDTIRGVSEKPVPSPYVGAHSGRHKGQRVETRKYTYARIDQLWQPFKNQMAKAAEIEGEIRDT